MYKGRKISVVIPCYNEADGIRKVIAVIPKFVDEILVIDNASSDDTVKNASEAGAVVIRHKENMGYGGSYITGFSSATGDIIVACDGDHTYPIECCQNVLDILIEESIDFISCCRFPLVNKANMHIRNRIGNRLLTQFTNLLFGMQIQDSLSGMWFLNRNILPIMNLTCTHFGFSPEIKIEAFTNEKIKAAEVHVTYRSRSGESKLIAWKDGLDIALFILKKRLRKK